MPPTPPLSKPKLTAAALAKKKEHEHQVEKVVAANISLLVSQLCPKGVPKIVSPVPILAGSLQGRQWVRALWPNPQPNEKVVRAKTPGQGRNDFQWDPSNIPEEPKNPLPFCKVNLAFRPNSGPHGGCADADVLLEYTLLEIDCVNLPDQLALWGALISKGFPVVSLAYSGKKSYHATVRVNGKSLEDYKAKVTSLREGLLPYGLDRSTQNPSRNTRFPGYVRIFGPNDDGTPPNPPTPQELIYLCPDAPVWTPEEIDSELITYSSVMDPIPQKVSTFISSRPGLREWTQSGTPTVAFTRAMDELLGKGCGIDLLGLFKNLGHFISETTPLEVKSRGQERSKSYIRCPFWIDHSGEENDCSTYLFDRGTAARIPWGLHCSHSSCCDEMGKCSRSIYDTLEILKSEYPADFAAAILDPTEIPGRGPINPEDVFGVIEPDDLPEDTPETSPNPVISPPEPPKPTGNGPISAPGVATLPFIPAGYAPPAKPLPDLWTVPFREKLKETAANYVMLPPDDDSNAKILKCIHGRNMLWIPDRSRWMLWCKCADTGLVRWKLSIGNGSGLEREWAKDVASYRVRAMPDEPKHVNAARKAANDKSIVAMLVSLQSDPEMQASMNDFDVDPLLLGVANGVLHLPTGKIIPNRRELKVSLFAPTKYDPDAPNDTFAKTAAGWHPGKPEITRYLQALLGYSITGLKTIERLNIITGEGAGGKSSYWEIPVAVLGPDYASTPPPHILVSKRDMDASRATPEVATLSGKRFCACNEPPNGGTLLEDNVKRFCGPAGNIDARMMHGNPIPVKLTAKFLLVTNTPPKLSTHDSGLTRRLATIAFCETFVDDPDFKAGLRTPEALEGALRWMVEGYQIFATAGLPIPEECQLDSAEYSDSANPLLDFVHTVITPFEDGKVEKAEIYRLYVDWSRRLGEQPVIQRQLTTKLKQLGDKFPGFSWESNGVSYWKGVVLKEARAD